MLNFITWDANPMLIDSFIQIRWYSLMFAVGFWIGYNIVAKMFKHEGAPERWLMVLLLWTMLGTVVGARLGHVFFYEWSYYSQHLSEIPKVWHGGLASHGGTIGVILGVLCFSWFTTKRSPLWTFDRLVVPIALVGALIRIGNLMNSEIYGHPTDLPWGFIFVRGHEYPGLPCHPTQLYEAAAYLGLFVLLMWMYWKKNEEERPGLIFGTFLTILFTARFLIEFVKNDQVGFEANMTLNMGQLLSIPFIVIGLFFMIRAILRPRVKIEFPNRFAPEIKNK
ncbi:MAG: prolipoprotein diacylglyceryl transferase [Muribaculaceae bacterium]|nr:prolipoprotein diacylglyceryl transferase [Muribaculaceae bacterium]